MRKYSSSRKYTKKISDIGEFALIDIIKAPQSDPDIKVSIGDDAAVVKHQQGLYLYTTDTIVEDVHFNNKWFTPYQIGLKAIEINVSDIAAMGGSPLHALISLDAPENTPVKYVTSLNRGIRKAASKYGIDIIGGNMAAGKKIIINVLLTGKVKKENLALRSKAKIGDLIMISGYTGLSITGYNLLKNNIAGFTMLKKAFLQPEAELAISKIISKAASSMQDISDGLLQDLDHICKSSNTGAEIYTDKLPVHKEIIKAGKVLGSDPVDCVLNGGEDFRLLYTVPESKATLVPGYVIGKIIKEKSIYLFKNGVRKKAAFKGYDHFK